jgi:hypothetical protein
MKDIKVNELNEATKSDEIEMTDEEMGQVKGGIGLLLPAVQKVREAARTEKKMSLETSTITYTGLE